jgi:hypothetical protein
MDELKDRLEKLIELSPTIKSLSEVERNLRVNNMLNSSPEKMQEIIKILEEEQEFMQGVESEFQQHADEVSALYEEVKEEKHIQDRRERKQAETEELKVANKEASILMQKLENVAIKEPEKPEESQRKKSKFADLFKGKITLMKFVRGTLAAIIGAVLCGLAGILVVFGIVFSMGKYVKLEVVYNLEPPVSFNAYWFALIYAALIGFILIPLLRLIRKKSFLLSLLLGGIIGGLLLALSHMAFGLDTDILLLQDSTPIHLRGYWVAFAFAVVVGFLGQFAYRLINLGEFFNLTSKENSIE